MGEGSDRWGEDRDEALLKLLAEHEKLLKTVMALTKEQGVCLASIRDTLGELIRRIERLEDAHDADPPA